ncbi:MAG: metal-dependent hydrolase [Akkermansiaceae bacterium]|jgi:inner membrane protein|nr:metal-dependent hydrolase [Akkermansiaceae bacterium]MDP4646693.1 metal-dependent hydrolase [Akkermansiaceae bacterium]MDP4721097.1 metal-dependent hydrolase [Akkermansiaceae bacterium]MDP4779609.1 metal-dependent hydrolase [Akkermansiaceae bacterium]MDP4846311.1 metal-dependent hydrolase [Akkermansiaceae bacterium]
MDSITQAVLGAAVGEAILGKKIGNRAMIWGLLFGTLPDLDIIANPLLDTAERLEFHRGASHSLLVMVIASILLAKPLSKLWKREKVTPTRAGAFVFLVWSTHVLIDCFTVYGTSVLWPFSDTRIAFNNLFIIDPLYTLPLIVTLIWLAFYRTKKQQQKRTRLLKWGLGLSTAYVAITFGLKSLVSAAFDADLARRNINYERRIEAPTPLNTLLWRSVVDRGDEMWVGYRSVFELSSTPVRWTVYPKESESIAPYQEEREIKTLIWFSRGWWIARPHAKGVWLADMRFGESRTYDAKPDAVDSRFMFSWSFIPDAERDRLRSSTRPNIDAKDTLRRLGLRIVGNTEQWEASPRLAGVPGTLPEFLRVVE